MGFFLWFIFKLLPFFFFILFGVFILNNNYFFSYTFKFKVFFLFIYNCFYFLYKLIFLKNYFFKKYFCNYYLWLTSYRCQWQHAGLKYIFFLCAALPKFCYRARVGVCVPNNRMTHVHFHVNDPIEFENHHSSSVSSWLLPPLFSWGTNLDFGQPKQLILESWPFLTIICYHNNIYFFYF